MATADVQMLPLSTTDALQRMAELVRDGNIADAVVFGNQHDTPLAVATSDLITHGELGKGSESTIRAGIFSDKPVAIKKAIIRNTKDLERFRREVGMLSLLRHDNVVPLRAARAIPPAYMMLLPQYSGSLEVWCLSSVRQHAMPPCIGEQHDKCCTPLCCAQRQERQSARASRGISCTMPS